MYPPGPHTLRVTYNGAILKTPLILAYLVIQNFTQLNSTVESSTGSTTHSNPNPLAIVFGVIGGVAYLFIVTLFVLRRKPRSNGEVMPADEPTYYFPAFPPSQLPTKIVLEELHSESSVSLSPGHRPGPSEPLSMSTPETAKILNRSTTVVDAQHSQNPNPSDSHVVSDTTGRVDGPSSSVDHQDSGARLPQVESLVDNPPPYSLD